MSLISKIVGSASDSDSDSGDTTYKVLLAAQSAEIMKAAPSFVQNVLSANQSSDDVESVNLITLDTNSLVTMLAKSASSVSTGSETTDTTTTTTAS